MLKKSIVLVGLMGAGKSSLGRMLAAEFNCGFVDSDEVIVEREGRSISTIFAENGEPYFRDLETKVVRDLVNQTKPQVIGTGGGAFMNENTRRVIKESATAVFLRANLNILLNRVGKGEGRPILEAGNPSEILQKLIAERYPTYSQADITVKTYNEDPQVTCDRVKQALYNYAQHP